MRRSRREPQEWRAIFDEQARSGLTAVEFCRQQHINLQTFYARRSDIRLQRTRGKFVQVKKEVTSIEAHQGDDEPPFKLVYGESELAISQDVHPQWLASLMKALNE